MARVWLGGAIGALGVCALFAMTNCAEPTQIVVHVFTDACPGSGRAQVISRTGIAVGTASTIESHRPAATKVGCESPGGVGTLTIYPSGSNDDEVAIKVLGGVELAPDACDPPLYAGCIVYRRMMRFIPHQTQHATVRLLLACLDRQCPAGLACYNGGCVAVSDILEDGGIAADSHPIESGVIPDAASDGANPSCAGCKGTCDGTKCNVDCAAVDCNAGDVCAKALDCTMTCAKTGKCTDVMCTTDKKCTVDCGPEKNSCAKVRCKADECHVNCRGDETCSSNGDISLIGTSKASLDCEGQAACKAASCESKECILTCHPFMGKPGDVACPNPKPCTPRTSGACDQWNSPNQNSN